LYRYDAREDLAGLGQAVLEAEPPAGSSARAAAEAARLSSTMSNVVGRGSVGGAVPGFEFAHLTAAAAAEAVGAGAGPGPGSEAGEDDTRGGGGGARDGYAGLRTLVGIVSTGDASGKAAAAGCITQLCGLGKHVVQKVHALGGVPPLAALLIPPEAEAGGKKKKKAPPVPPEVMRGIVNASGALRLLSFEDYIKPDIMACDAVVGLAKLVKMKGKKWNLNMDAYNNAIGCLYNLAQDKRNTDALEEAGLPSYLVRPFPAAWMCDPESEDDEAGGDAVGATLTGPAGLNALDPHYGLPEIYDYHHEDGDIPLFF
jgi:hypothetical protein